MFSLRSSFSLACLFSTSCCCCSNKVLRISILFCLLSPSALVTCSIAESILEVLSAILAVPLGTRIDTRIDGRSGLHTNNRHATSDRLYTKFTKIFNNTYYTHIKLAPFSAARSASTRRHQMAHQALHEPAHATKDVSLTRLATNPKTKVRKILDTTEFSLLRYVIL